MVEIAPFPAVRYNLNKFSTLSGVICPPYDIISVPEYHRLLARHTHNMARIELPLAQGKGDRYEIAATLWCRWQNQRMLVADKEPAFYGYEERFSVGNQPFFRRGFFAALRLETPGKGHIRPHERTFPKHKEDRLRLMRATHANISPVFGIFFDRRKKAQALLTSRMSAKPLVVSRDDKGVTHRLWKWADAEAIKLLCGVLRTEEVLIADGHHRYETAWNYAQERAAHDRSASTRRRAYRYVLIFLCPLEDPGLVIQPTHRAVRMALPWEEWQDRFSRQFNVQRLTGLTSLIARLRQRQEHSGIGVVLAGGRLLWLRPKEKKPSMPVVALHQDILKDIPLEVISYGQNARDMVQNLQRGESDAVFLLPPPDKEAFARICRAGKLLPQKSTYFYPKVATGLVMRILDGDVSHL